ncbi:hypothetical protein ACMXYN_08440 [Neptuniibacter sp. PT8_73]|uniref:hypothetical protein n=1 Tax=unclassified Neptuniibacter TaxID=2630693 RepID=UPI0039F4D53A
MEETDKQWIADYLRLEFGEDESDPDSVKAEEIKHIGHFIINGTPTDYFTFPQSGDSYMWAIIEKTEVGNCAGMTSTPPPELSNESCS